MDALVPMPAAMAMRRCFPAIRVLQIAIADWLLNRTPFGEFPFDLPLVSENRPPPPQTNPLENLQALSENSDRFI